MSCGLSQEGAWHDRPEEIPEKMVPEELKFSLKEGCMSVFDPKTKTIIGQIDEIRFNGNPVSLATVKEDIFPSHKKIAFELTEVLHAFNGATRHFVLNLC